jgi:hypothetical protein
VKKGFSVWDRSKKDAEIKALVDGKGGAPDAAAQAISALDNHDETRDMNDHGEGSMHEVQEFQFADQSVESRVLGASTADDIIGYHVVSEIEEAFSSVATGGDIFLAEDFEQGTEFAPIGGFPRGTLPGAHPIFRGTELGEVGGKEINATTTAGTTTVSPGDDGSAFIAHLDRAGKATCEGAFPPVKAGMGLWAERGLSIEGLGCAQFGGVQVAVEAVIQFSEVDSPNIPGGGRDEGLEVTNNDAQGEGCQGTGRLSSEEAN